MKNTQIIALMMALPTDDMAVLAGFAKGITLPEKEQHDYFFKGGYKKEKEDFKQTLQKVFGEKFENISDFLTDITKLIKEEEAE